MNLKSQIETILFVHGDPISLKKLCEITTASPEEIIEVMSGIRQEYIEAGRGFVILEHEHAWQLASNPENSALVQELQKSQVSEELSKAAVETLAIIAYKGPLSKTDIEYVRGVNSSFTIRNLLLRGLIERTGESNNRSHMYQITFEFLKYLGLENIRDLPQYEELKTKIEEVQSEVDTGNEGVAEEVVEVCAL